MRAVERSRARWLEQAQGDLEHAELSHANGHDEWACFAAQQAAEKALKAVLIERRGRLVRGHDLFQLGQQAEVPKGLLERCLKLTPAYVGTRYADAPEYPAEERAEEDISTAREVIAWANSQLS